MILLEESWGELFVLCAIQLCLPMENCTLFSAAAFASTPGSSAKSPQTAADLRFLSELVQRFRLIGVDPAEFACLKAVILFKHETRGLKVRAIHSLHAAASI